MTSSILAVVGIGHDGPAGLSAEAREHIAAAYVLAGGRRHLDFFPNWRGEKIVFGADVDAVCRHHQGAIPSGEGGCAGIGRSALLRHWSKRRCRRSRRKTFFLPQLSSVQLAFARVKETWQDACVVSLHGRPLETLIPAVEARGEDRRADGPEKHSRGNRRPAPPPCARAEDYVLWVCENLGGPDEPRLPARPRPPEWRGFFSLNLVILLRHGEGEAPAEPGHWLGGSLALPGSAEASPSRRK